MKIYQEIKRKNLTATKNNCSYSYYVTKEESNDNKVVLLENNRGEITEAKKKHIINTQQSTSHTNVRQRSTLKISYDKVQ